MVYAPPSGAIVWFKSMLPNGGMGTNSAAPMLFKNLPVDPNRDLPPVSLLALNPGMLSYAPDSNGSISHLATELLKTIETLRLLGGRGGLSIVARR
ncbi:MAG: hypothetical protein LW719_11625 [Comamonadaceae bacterium]|nr:hypothetical protein [Comamonadaceae bacterium]